MKLLIATNLTQGKRTNDFNHADDGEILIYPKTCNHGSKSPDSPCGCNRCMIGIITHKCTTTMQVAEVNITQEKFANDYVGAMQDAGFHNALTEEAIEMNKLLAYDLIERIERFNIGDVLEYRSDKFRKRKI